MYDISDRRQPLEPDAYDERPAVNPHYVNTPRDYRPTQNHRYTVQEDHTATAVSDDDHRVVQRSGSASFPVTRRHVSPLGRIRVASTACQTEYNSKVAMIMSGGQEPRGPKVFFRIVYDDKVLQFKLSCDCCFKVMFAAVNVRADFVWHGVVLDEHLAPADYNMLPGEEHTSTIQVVRSSLRHTTHAEDIAANDVARSLGFRLRLQEEKNERLELELDQMEAQIANLHRELQSVADRSEMKIEELQLKCHTMDQKRRDALDEAEHYRREVESLQRQLAINAVAAQSARAKQQHAAGNHGGAANRSNPSALFNSDGPYEVTTPPTGALYRRHAPSDVSGSDITETPLSRLAATGQPTIVDRYHPAPNPISQPSYAAATTASARRNSRTTSPATGKKTSRTTSPNTSAITPPPSAQASRTTTREEQIKNLRSGIEAWQQHHGTTSSGGKSRPAELYGAAVKKRPEDEFAAVRDRQGIATSTPAAAHRPQPKAVESVEREEEKSLSPTRTASEASPEMSFSRKPARPSQQGGSDEPDERVSFAPPPAAPTPPPPETFLRHTSTVEIRCVLMDETSQKETSLGPVKIPPGTPATVATAMKMLLDRNAAVIPPVNECMLCVQPADDALNYRVLDTTQATTTALSHKDTLFVARLAVTPAR